MLVAATALSPLLLHFVLLSLVVPILRVVLIDLRVRCSFPILEAVRDKLSKWIEWATYDIEWF